MTDIRKLIATNLSAIMHQEDITQAHEDEDGPLNYCRACGRKLAQSG